MILFEGIFSNFNQIILSLSSLVEIFIAKSFKKTLEDSTFNFFSMSFTKIGLYSLKTFSYSQEFSYFFRI